jgi:glutamyl-tRNA synthetase
MINRSDLKLSRTRIAPTPSGYLHLGNAASFIITAGLAKQFGADILLRIDDLDQDRLRAEYVQDIFDTLRFLGIPWDRGPADPDRFTAEWSQMHRVSLGREALDALVASGDVFACTCSRSELAEAATGAGYPGTCLSRQIPLDTPGVSWRLKTDPDAMVRCIDLLDGVQHFPLPATMQHFIVRRKNGLPSYQLASVVDDMHFEVDLVVRGADLFDSTLAQLYLCEKLPSSRFGQTVFFHHPLISDISGRKLSKSAGDTSVRFFREQGKIPADLFSAIAGAYGIPGTFNHWEDLAYRLMQQWLA